MVEVSGSWGVTVFTEGSGLSNTSSPLSFVFRVNE